MRKNYLNVKVCKECGGKCCKHMPGIAHPSEFGKPLEKKLIEAFNSGHWAIDWYEGDPTGKDKLYKVYFIRPKIKGVKELFDPTWGGECIFLAYDGCTLKPLERPKGCRLLEPVSLEHCISHMKDKAMSARPWIPHQKVILSAARAVGERVNNAHNNYVPSPLEALLDM